MTVAALTFPTPTSIPIEIGKWLAIVETFGARQNAHRDAQEITGEPNILSHRPDKIEVLEGGIVRILYDIEEHFYQRMKGWVPPHSDSGKHDVVIEHKVPLFVNFYYKAGAKQPIDCARALAEIVLTLLDTFRAVGSADPGTLRDCFTHHFTWQRHRQFESGPLPNSKTLSDEQMSSILQVCDQCRTLFKCGPDRPRSGYSAYYRTPADLENLRALAPPLVPVPVPVVQPVAPPLPPPQLQPPPPPPPTTGCVDSCLPQNAQASTIRVLRRPADAQPVATERMCFTCESVEDVPVMVAKLMAVCTSGRVCPEQVKPYELQILDGVDNFPVRIVMHVHRLIADDVKRVPDWLRPYRDWRVLLKVPLPAWDEGGVVAPLAHSVNLAALLHAWFAQCSRAVKNRCKKRHHAFTQLVTGEDGAKQPTLTEEQQHILLELSEEYLGLLHNEWCKQPAGTPPTSTTAERTESPKNVEVVEFPKLGASPTANDGNASTGRTTYMGSMFAITKPTMRPLDLKQLSSVSYLSPYRKDKIWFTGPSVALGWGVYTGTPRRVVAW